MENDLPPVDKIIDKNQIIKEVSETVSGLDRGVDPRHEDVLDEEDKRLKSLALQALIDAKRRRTE